MLSGAGGSWDDPAPENPGMLDVANEKYDAPAQPGESTGHRVLRSAGRTAMMIPNLLRGAYTSFANPPTPVEQQFIGKQMAQANGGEQPSPEEISRYGQQETTGLKRIGLGLRRLTGELPSELEAEREQNAAKIAQNPQQRKALEDAAGSSEIAAHVPLVGPLAMSLAKRIQGDPLGPTATPEQPYGEKDIAGGLTDAAAMFAVPKIAEEAMPGGRLPGAAPRGELALPATRAVLGKTSDAVGNAIQSARTAISPDAMTAEQAATKAFRPRNSKTNWKQEIASSLPDARRAADSLGIDVNQMSLDDALKATSRAKKDVWGEYQDNFMGPNQKATVDTTPVAGALRKSLSDRQIEQNPAFADRISNIADSYSQRQMSLQDVEDRVKELNNETRGIEAKYLTDKRAAKLDPQNAPLFVERDGLRSLLLNKLDELSGPGAADLRKRWGALNSLEDVVSRRIPVADRAAPESLPKTLSKAYAAGRIAKGIFTFNPGDVLEGGVSLLSARRAALMNDPEFLTQQAFKKTAPTGPARIPAQIVTPQPSPLTGIAGMLPRGRYEQPAGTPPSEPLQLEHMQPIEGEYLKPSMPPIKGLLNRGQYDVPPRGAGDMQFNQPQLPARASAIPLPATKEPTAGQPPATEPTVSSTLPTRTADTMGDAISMSSPNGRVSKRSAEAARQRLSEKLFGPGGMDEAVKPVIPQPSETESLLRQAQQLRDLAGRGMKPKAYAAKAAELEAKAATSGGYGSPTQVLTSNQNLPGKYRVVEADSLIPSHDAGTFAQNPKYPAGVQERTYHTSKEAQARVIQQAQNYDPNYTINTNPDAVNGPPVVTKDGIVLGGNSRTMSTQRLYASGKGDAYKNELARQAQTFGLDPQQIAKMKRPVLVREVTPQGGVEGMRQLGADLNKSMTGALGVSEKAVSAGRSISPETLDAIGGMRDQIGEQATLRDVLRQHGKQVLDMLARDGAVTDRERPALVDTTSGGLSEEGKTFAERALLGSVVDDPVLMENAPKSVLDKVGGSLGDLVKLGSRDDEWNILPLVREALADHAEMASSGQNMATYLNQPRMFGAQRSPAVEAVVRTLGAKPKAVRQALRDFTEGAQANQPGQPTLGLMRTPSAAEAFNEAFRSDISDEDLMDAIRDSMARETPHDIQRFKAKTK
jgi:hypothetical protein